MSNYLARVRLTKGVHQWIRALSGRGGWQSSGAGWEGLAGELRLQGWSRSRRVVVLRRRLEREPPPALSEAAGGTPEWVAVTPEEPYEYTVLVTNTDWELLALARLYRERADSENIIDERKRQWGSRRIRDQGLAALPGGGAPRGAGLQLVEPVRALRRSEASRGRPASKVRTTPAMSEPKNGGWKAKFVLAAGGSTAESAS